MVCSIKTHSKKSLEDFASHMNDKIQTLLKEIEAVINNWPLNYMCEEVDELLPLTASHFFISKRINFLPDVHCTTELKSNKKKCLQKFLDAENKSWTTFGILAIRSTYLSFIPTISPLLLILLPNLKLVTLWLSMSIKCQNICRKVE